jgi:hypothetical protein
LVTSTARMQAGTDPEGADISYSLELN